MPTITLRGNPVEVAGQLPAVGASAPALTLTGADLSEVTLASFAGKKILNIFPSVDTPTCALSVRKFNEQAAGRDGVTVLCISADLPFAQKRFCGAEGIDGVVNLSTFRHPEFRKDWGVEFASGPLVGLCARAVVVLGEDDRVLYSQLVGEVGDEPDYAAALAVL
ncbi:thiol peroxidase [Crenobacter caeni]|uniref:Thiol peroxidase n=1 Tax=Crenobacter caeni TaxID=2705474 RepID=A0A6B2KT31_9NEIS|nr:thiol peroxidase [Crenobacter caeni]NDV13406.1 thiol peroxidase [Crenobacter caeni]